MSNRISMVVLVLIFACSQSMAQQLEQAVEALAGQISETLATQEKKKVAILPFTDLAGCTTQLGQLLAEELTNQVFLRKDGRFDVVERSKVDAIWREQELGSRGWLNAAEVIGVGQLAGADAILAGTIGELEDRLRLNARMIAIPSGKLFATSSTFMLKTGLGNEMLQSSCATAKPGQAIKVQSMDVKNVTFDLIGCEKEVRLVRCKLVAVNNDVDRSLLISTNHNNSSLYDQSGRVFYANSAKIANKEGRDVQIRLITEVPTELEIHYQGVPSTIEFIKVFSFYTNLGQVEFRDVRFSN
jgi:TolB-like protein